MEGTKKPAVPGMNSVADSRCDRMTGVLAVLVGSAWKKTDHAFHAADLLAHHLGGQVARDDEVVRLDANDGIAAVARALEAMGGTPCEDQKT